MLSCEAQIKKVQIFRNTSLKTKEGKTIKLNFNEESVAVNLQKEDMVKELLQREVSDSNKITYNMDKESFKRKLNLFEMGHESVRKGDRETNTKIARNKSLRQSNMEFNKINSKIVCCEQKHRRKNLGFLFGHGEHCKSLTFRNDSIDCNAEGYEDLKQVEPSRNVMSKPADIIKELDFEPELILHEEMEILNKQAIYKNKKMSVSDLVQFYESSNKACQSECLVNKNIACGDEILCKYFTDSEMSKEAEHESVQQVYTLSNNDIENGVQRCQNASYTDVKADINIQHEESKSYFCGHDETCSDARTEFDLMQIDKRGYGNDIFNFKHYLSTDNVVNEIDLRFIYSIY